MARPPLIQKLRHGTLLTGRAFRWFVETWNWLTSYVDNMRGDFDVNPRNGYITIDRTNPDVPVVRFRTDNLPVSEGGGSGMCGNFAYNADSHTIKNGYVFRGRSPVYVLGVTVSAAGYAYVSVPYTGTVEIVSGASSVPSNTASATYVPLYYINSDLAVTGDYRGAPVVQMWE